MFLRLLEQVSEDSKRKSSGIISCRDKETLNMNGCQVIWRKEKREGTSFTETDGLWVGDYGNIHDSIKKHNELMFEIVHLLSKHWINGK